MKIDFSHPGNRNTLRYLRNPFDMVTGPQADSCRRARRQDLSNSRIKDHQSPDSIDVMSMGTHPDVVDRLWKEITVLLPEPCQWVIFGGPVLVNPQTGVIFGWAGGSHDYSLRLPEKIKADALEAGAKTTTRYSTGDELDLAQIGPEWVFGHWIQEEPRWCLKAYEFAD